MNSFKFSFLNASHIQQIEDLRRESFHKYYKASVDLKGLSWNNMDKKSIHLGVFSDNILISYLRLSFFNNIDMLDLATQIKTPPELKAPIALLARAATKSEYLHSGLHSQLRSIALQLCLLNNVDCVVGSLEEKSLRKNQLLDLGYKIVSSIEKWENSYIKNSGNVILIALVNKAEIDFAIKKLNQKINSFGPIEWPAETPWI